MSERGPLEGVSALRRRAARFRRKGEPRKAILALREAAALEPSGASFVRLAHLLQEVGKRDEALHALRQALYCFRYDDMRGRARTVARLILALDPEDRAAQKRAA
jgi:tetratricopeptide (TPR) repeat protein